MSPAHCFMFYEHHRDLCTDWLDAVTQIFSLFGLEPSHVLATGPKKKINGGYSRVRKRLSAFVQEHSRSDDFDVQIDSRRRHEYEDFLPCDLRLAWNNSTADIAAGMVSVRSERAGGLADMADRVAPIVYGQIGPAYANAFDFPAIYGPGYYLSSVGTFLRGQSTLANEEYNARMTRWRDRVWHDGKRPSQGYFREIYPINFLFETQLSSSFRGRNLSDYMLEHGSLERCEFDAGIFRWDIEPGTLHVVRRDLETSGLVLSSPVVK